MKVNYEGQVIWEINNPQEPNCSLQVGPQGGKETHVLGTCDVSHGGRKFTHGGTSDIISVLSNILLKKFLKSYMMILTCSLMLWPENNLIVILLPLIKATQYYHLMGIIHSLLVICKFAL
jgi:hypothetical protein